MRVCVQWATGSPADWTEVDAAEWEHLPKHPPPLGGERLDTLGFVNAVCVQGVVFQADHYAVRPFNSSGCRVWAWNDDFNDWEPEERVARVVTFRTLAPDDKFRGAYNTRHEQIVYAGSSALARLQATPAENTEYREYKHFRPPDNGVVRHGIWLPDKLYAEHENVLTVQGWRHWTEGVPEEEIIDGRVRDQRKVGRFDPPKGTQTFYHRNISQAIGAVAANFENLLRVNVGAAATQSGGDNTGNGNLVWGAITQQNRPRSAQWPTGTYRAQLDVTAASADADYGLLTLGTTNGFFARVSSDTNTILESKQQVQAPFTLTGLKLATTGVVSWAAGAKSNRYLIAIVVRRASGHGNQQITLELNEQDDFADGPWRGIRNAVFFGTNF